MHESNIGLWEYCYACTCTHVHTHRLICMHIHTHLIQVQFQQPTVPADSPYGGVVGTERSICLPGDSQYYSTRPPSSFKLHRSCSPPLLSFSPPERPSVHPADLHFGPELGIFTSTGQTGHS